MTWHRKFRLEVQKKQQIDVFFRILKKLIDISNMVSFILQCYF